MTNADTEGVFGLPPESLIPSRGGAVQLSPLMPGSSALEDISPGTLAGMTMMALPGTVERRYALALALRALAPGALFTVLAPKDRGGSRLLDELRGFGCAVDDTAKRHHRICSGTRPESLTGVAAAVAEGGPRRLEPSGLWSQPGIFSWDHLDPGTALLMRHLPALSGSGADFGCGIGTIALTVLKSAKVKHVQLIDLDRRALQAARCNVEDARVTLRWADLRQPDPALTKLDFVVMNPPFHDGGAEDRSLGQIFVRRAAEALRKGGRLWLTANRHLPYEAAMTPLFRTITPVVEAHGYKVYEAVR